MKGFIPWVGGKRLLAETIVALMPEHACYVEPFGGAAHVLFAKTPTRTEVYNDLDGRLVALFRSVKEHPEELARQLDFVVPSRELFDLYREQPGLTEIQQAARFYYVLKCSFGAKAATFAASVGSGSRLVRARMLATMEGVRQRFERVIVERRDFGDILGRFDRPGTLFFLDPPYVDAERQYQVRFRMPDNERLREALADLQAAWILTYGDHEWVRTAYADRHVYAVEAPYTVNSGDPAEGRQLIVTSFRPTRAQLRAAPKRLTRLRQKASKTARKRAVNTTSTEGRAKGKRRRRS